MALESKLNCGVSYILGNCEEVLVLSDWSMAWAPEALISTWQGLTRDTLLETTALRSCEHVSMRVTFPYPAEMCVCAHVCVSCVCRQCQDSTLTPACLSSLCSGETTS